MQPNLTLSQIARTPSESVRPELWPAHAWIPALGIQGATVHDVSGKNNGTVTGGSAWAIGIQGSELVFNDTNTRLISSAAASFPPDAGTVVFWGRPDWTLSHRFFWDTYGGGNRRFLFWRSAGHLVELYTDSVARGTVAHGLTMGRWYHFALVWGVNKLYRDGTLFHTFPAGGLGNGASTLTIGNRYTTDTHGFEGALGEFAVYHRALTDSEIMTLAADPLLPFRRRAVTPYWVMSGEPPASNIPVIMNHRRLIGCA